MGRHDRTSACTDMPWASTITALRSAAADGRKNFVYSHEQIMQKYQKNIKMVDRIPDALSRRDEASQMYVATFSTTQSGDDLSSSTPMFPGRSPTADAAAASPALSQVLRSGRAHLQALTPNAQPQPGGQAHHCCDKDPHPRRHQGPAARAGSDFHKNFTNRSCREK